MSACAAPMQPMTQDGGANSTLGSVASRNKIGDAFLAALSNTNPEPAALFGKKWADVPEEYACANQIHELNATFLTTVYTMTTGASKGDHLSQDSAQNYWGGMIYDLKKRFQHSTKQSTKVSTPP